MSKVVNTFCSSVNPVSLHFTGVIWKGDKLIDGVPGTLDMLRSKVSIITINLVYVV